jgi:PKD repeat protein
MDPVNWTPNVLDGEVHAFAQVGSLMIAGGKFTRAQAPGAATAVTRSNVLAFNATTGAIDNAFAPVTDGEVDAIVPVPGGTQVYLAGVFNTVNGVARPSLALVNVADGSVVTTFKAPSFDGAINDAALVGNELWVAGNFTYPNPAVATVNPTTGKYDGFAPLHFAGVHGGTTTAARALDVTPDGTRAVVIGNFTTVDGMDRHQIVMLDLTGATAAVLTSWQTNDYSDLCDAKFPSYMRDVDFSPDGEYFVVGTTGGRGPNPDALCDTAVRWETGATGSGLHPTWIAHTGGDTIWSLAVTGAAVYAGGHFRWFNNPYALNVAGAGAVPRSGIVALDPSTGLPLSWNPGRDLGIGVFDIYATSAGLWIGNDTNEVADEVHGKLAFFPLAGGTTISRPSAGSLPSTLYRLGQGAPSNMRPLYRVNAGGPPVAAIDGGPDWAADLPVSTLHNAGAVPGSWNPVTAVDPVVPASTPLDVFRSDLTDLGTAPEMSWALPVAAGTPVSVRLYFAEQNGATAQNGQRIFDVSLDGHRVLDQFDIVYNVGYRTGTMRSFDIVSDGTVNIDFQHEAAADPLIDAVEIVPTCGMSATTSPNDVVTGRSFDGTVAGPATTVPSSRTAWSQNRGAFMLSGTAYTGWADGHLCAATFNGASFANWRVVPLFGSRWATQLPTVTGMFYANHAIYYARSDSPSLYYRPFSASSEVVGATERLASDSVPGIDFSQVGGMFVAGGKLYFVTRSDGVLHRIDWNGHAPVGGTAANVSGPGVDGASWSGQGLLNFVNSSAVAPNEAPHASLAANCTYLSCALTSAGSGDPDGTVASHLWDFGDGTTSSVRTPTHTYAQKGSYTLRLTVTDDQGASATSTLPLTVIAPNQPPVAAFTVNCTALSCAFDGTNSTDSDGSVASYTWTFGDGTSGTGATPSHVYGSVGAYSARLTVTDNQGATDSRSKAINVIASQSAVGFVGESHTAGSTTSWSVTVPSSVAGGDGLLLVASFNSTAAGVTPPSGWSLVGSKTSGSLITYVYQRVATTGDAGTTVKFTASTTTKADVSLMAYRGTSAAGPVSAWAAAPGGISSSTHTTPTITVPDNGSWVVSLWADKSSSTSTNLLMPPAGQTNRHQTCGTGSGHVCALGTDGGGSVAAGTVAGGLTASADWSSASDTMWTVVLR